MSDAALDGYPVDVAFDAVFARELMPSWLSFAAALAGRPPIALGRPLRYVDLGCGVGVSAGVVAACYPDARVTGFDGNPAHVEVARELAQTAGLGNLQAEHATFAELAANPRLAPGSVDVIVVYGVYSWVSAANRRHIVRIADQLLAPGGIVCVSALALAGWASMLPVQRLLRVLADRAQGTSTDRARSALARLAELRASGLFYFESHPALAPILDSIAAEDPRHVAHAYLGEHFVPMTSRQLAADFAAAGCTRVSSAKLTTSLALAVPDALRPVIASIADPDLREMAVDIASRETGRLEIFRRGDRRLSAAERAAVVRGTMLTATMPAGTVDVEIEVSGGGVTLPAAWCSDLVARCTEQPATVGDLFAEEPDESMLRLAVEGGLVHPVVPGWEHNGSVEASARFNAALARLAGTGQDPARLLAAPAIGSALVVATSQEAEAPTGANRLGVIQAGEA